ncbi:MAG: nucleotidyltransferase domain-containing protein [archaeon]
MILKNTKLRNKLKQIVKESSELEDIILFGSAVRGKEKPNDIDILVLFKNKVDKQEGLKIRKELEKECEKVSIISKTRKTVLEESFDARESVLFEGVSLISAKNPAETYGFVSFGMFKYDFKKWSKLEKTKFYHALNGRDGKEGMLKILNCIKLSNNILMAPIGKVEPLREFLESWKLEYTFIPTIIPHRLSKKSILQR